MGIALAPYLLALAQLVSPDLLAGAAPAGPWTWGVTPPPQEGRRSTVYIYDAPSLPIEVVVYVGGVIVKQETVTKLPAYVDFTCPSGSAGDFWDVELTGGSSYDSQGGFVL